MFKMPDTAHNKTYQELFSRFLVKDGVFTVYLIIGRALVPIMRMNKGGQDKAVNYPERRNDGKRKPYPAY